MRIKIKGATPKNIALTIEEIIDEFQVDMYEANIDINFSKNGVPLIFVNDKYEEIGLSTELNPSIEYTSKKNKFRTIYN